MLKLPTWRQRVVSPKVTRVCTASLKCRYDVNSDSGKAVLVDSPSEGNFFVLLISSTSKISLKKEQAKPWPFAMTVTTYPVGTLIVGKNLNPLVLEVLNKRKQNIINSFQFAKSRTLTQIVSSEHTAGHSAVQGGGKASESCVARIGKYNIG